MMKRCCGIGRTADWEYERERLKSCGDIVYDVHG